MNFEQFILFRNLKLSTDVVKEFKYGKQSHKDAFEQYLLKTT